MLDPNAVQPEKATSPRPDPSAGTPLASSAPLASAAAPGGAGGVTEGDIPPEATGILGNDEQPLGTPPEASEDAYIDGAEEDTLAPDYEEEMGRPLGPDEEAFSFDPDSSGIEDEEDPSGADSDTEGDFEFFLSEADGLEKIVSQEDAKETSKKYSYVTKEYDYDVADLEEALITGGMDPIRQDIAKRESDQRASLAQQTLAVIGQSPPTKELMEQARVLSMANSASNFGLSNQEIYKVDPSVVLEAKFAKKVLDTATDLLPANSPFWKTLNPSTEGKVDFLTKREDLALRDANLRNYLSDALVFAQDNMTI